jgi:hypothetical protein
MPTPATTVIRDLDSGNRHTYCDRHFREALAQCPLGADEKIRRARKHDNCEECPLDDARPLGKAVQP